MILGKKRPRDASQLVKSIVDIATGERALEFGNVSLFASEIAQSGLCSPHATTAS
jgi:hypothetical protein